MRTHREAQQLIADNEGYQMPEVSEFEKTYQKYLDESDPDHHDSMQSLFKWFYDAGHQQAMGEAARIADGATFTGPNAVKHKQITIHVAKAIREAILKAQ